METLKYKLVSGLKCSWSAHILVLRGGGDTEPNILLLLHILAGHQYLYSWAQVHVPRRQALMSSAHPCVQRWWGHKPKCTNVPMKLWEVMFLVRSYHSVHGVGEGAVPTGDAFKLFHCEARTVGKGAVDIRLKYLLVFFTVCSFWYKINSLIFLLSLSSKTRGTTPILLVICSVFVHIYGLLKYQCKKFQYMDREQYNFIKYFCYFKIECLWHYAASW